MKKSEPKKTACSCAQGSKPRPEHSPVSSSKLPPGRPAGANETSFWLHPSLIAGAARGLLKEIEAGNEIVLQLAGIPLLELARLTVAGAEFETRIRKIEARIKALEKAAAKK